MSNKHTWLDYANTAANVVQAAQLSSIESHLSRFDRLNIEQQAKLTEENELREKVFGAEEILEDALIHLETRPTHVLRRANLLKDGMIAAGVSSSQFSAFSDKERLRALQKALDNAITESRRRMTETGLKEYAECCKLQEQQRGFELAVKNLLCLNLTNQNWTDCSRNFGP